MKIKEKNKKQQEEEQKQLKAQVEIERMSSKKVAEMHLWINMLGTDPICSGNASIWSVQQNKDQSKVQCANTHCDLPSTMLATVNCQTMLLQLISTNTHHVHSSRMYHLLKGNNVWGNILTLTSVLWIG